MKNTLTTTSQISYIKSSDKMFAFIYDPQQRIYTVPRLE